MDKFIHLKLLELIGQILQGHRLRSEKTNLGKLSFEESGIAPKGAFHGLEIRIGTSIGNKFHTAFAASVEL